MSTKNDITGDSITSKAANLAFLNNYDSIFGKKERKQYIPPEDDESEEDLEPETSKS